MAEGKKDSVPSKHCRVKIGLEIVQWSIFLRGMLMGLCDLIPGISGGTIALATGIYDKLLHNVNQINFQFIKAFFRFDFRYLYNSLNWKFLFSLFLGMGSSVLLFCRVIAYCLGTPSLCFLLYSVIFGLAIGVIIYLIRQINEWKLCSFLFMALGFGVSFFFTFFGKCNLDYHVADCSVFFFDPALICSGAIAIAMGLLPGVSGSFVLLLLGQYYKVIGAVASITKGFSLSPFLVFLNLFLGIFAGAFFFSKIITFFLKKYNSFTLSFLSGLMIGAVHVIYPYSRDGYVFNFFSFDFYFSLILIIAASLLVLILKKNYTKMKT